MFRHESHPYQNLQGGQDSNRMHSKLIPFHDQQYRTRYHIQFIAWYGMMLVRSSWEVANVSQIVLTHIVWLR